MLVLSRREGETIRIGEDITVTVTKIRGSQIKIGIDAPRNIRIGRGDKWIENKSTGKTPNVESKTPGFSNFGELDSLAGGSKT